jgi:hypothetical protein
MGQGHPRGKHQGGLIAVTLVGAAPPLQRCSAQTGRTRDRTRPMLQLRQKVLAKAPSTRDPKRTWQARFYRGITN